ncbi:unnamed protein product [Rotaria sp. Silwood2]|nr:unnamed protein product [Rotaria sp. Silwood2]
MDTVFRIDHIQKLDSKSRIYQVNLKLTSDDDQQLRELTEFIRGDDVGKTGWSRLVYSNMGDYPKALEFYEKALKIAEIALPPNHRNRANSYNSIGTVYYNMGKYSKALECYDTVNKILEIALPCNPPDLATSYACTGVVYDEMGNYTKALLYLEKTLTIRQKWLPPTHPSIQETIDIINDVKKKL